MDRLNHWNRKRLLFWDLCVAQCVDEPQMLLKALGIIGEVGAC